MSIVSLYKNQRDRLFTVFGTALPPKRAVVVVHVVPAAQNTQLVFGSQAQIFCHKHGQDLGQVQHGGAVHVLLRVVKRVPELWEGGADEV